MPETAGLEKIGLEDLGPFQTYIEDSEITDIDYNGKALWVKDIYNCRKQVIVEENDQMERFVQDFSQKIANITSKSFNGVNPVLEAETKNLRITCVHETVAISGRSICIRKTSDIPRIIYEKAIEDGYATPDIFDFLTDCIRAKMNVVICGEPGVGKTELAKFLCQYIPDNERVITIEDNPEWHYGEINPKADCIELRVNEEFNYTKALKTCVRMNSDRIMLSEVRSVEAKYLIECWTGGVKGVTTLHTDDVRKIPDRILNMMPTRLDAERLENNVYESLDIGILLRTRAQEGSEQNRYRYIDQICFFERLDGENRIIPMVQDGNFIHYDKLPEGKKKKLEKAEIIDMPWYQNRHGRKGEQIEKEKGKQ